MIFTDEFVQALSNDPVDGTLKLCNQVLNSIDSRSQEWTDADHELLMEAFALLGEIAAQKLLPIPLLPPQLRSGSMPDECVEMYRFVDIVNTTLLAETSRLKLESLRSKFRVSLGRTFAYEFSQGDLDRVQNLLNQLRDFLVEAKGLDDKHRQRLLQRLESLQSELHKKVSDLDRFWGLIGDAGVVFGKLGEDAKPLVDRVRELVDIVWQTQSRAEELPSSAKLPSLKDERAADQRS